MIVTTMTALTVGALALPVLAAETPGSNGQSRKGAQAEVAKARAEARKTARLDTARKTKCENVERNVANRAANFVRHAERHLEVFDKIAERTKAFAIEKDKQPDNYDALVSEAGAKRAQAVTDIESFKSMAAQFDCDSDNPTAAGKVLKEQAKVVRASLKEYRTSIKNLIVGVKSEGKQ